MSELSLECIASVRDEASRLVESCAAYENQAEALVRSAEADLHSARTTLLSAREQHIAARRLQTQLDGQPADEVRRRTPAVLVVDDVADIREQVADVLRDAGFVVRTAANGLEALIAAHAILPEVIVMDVMMPVLDGIQATRLIKSTPATRRAQVIAYTATTSAADALPPLLFTSVLRKPAAPDVVLARVQEAVSLYV